MIQTHLLPLQPPFNYIYYGGIVGKQIATMVAAVDKTNDDTPFANGYLKWKKRLIICCATCMTKEQTYKLLQRSWDVLK